MKNTKQIMEKYDKYVLNTYKRIPMSIVKAKGSWVWDAEGKKYLDFFPGWAVSGLGHCHPRVVKAVREQAEKLLHVSNNYFSPAQAALAEKIIQSSFKGKVFFANSGAEANEAAIKLARAYGNAVKNNAFEIITMFKSFHGRTLATIAATGQDKVKKGFDPIPVGFKHVPFNDIDALKKEITDKTAAIMFEPVQGEGGINIATKEYMAAVRKLCDEQKILLILDEVQTGMGRSGKIFAYQHYGITPDAMTLAKSLGGGLPIGACVVKEEFTGFLKPGMHASTFGGSPIVCAASLAVFEAIEKDKLLVNANKMGKYFYGELKKLQKKYPIIKNIKQMALMIGVELGKEGDAIVSECLANRLLINCTQGNILRIMPAVIVTKKEINTAIMILDKALKNNA
ncbi:MAG: aspartate aminotransferase family protein [Candidatus Omnitrophica bacterium]|nr:aspartate aminotransferase family protein [Candidatus Omnitrophota bacterium]